MPIARIPPLSLVLGFGPALLLPAAAAAAWLLPPWHGLLAIAVGQIWGAAILLFLAGVRRGLSFHTEGGPRPVQIATMAWLFLLGLAGLVLPPPFALGMSMLGYASVAALDPIAARRGEVPVHFRSLRPPQMAVALIGLGGLLARILAG